MDLHSVPRALGLATVFIGSSVPVVTFAVGLLVGVLVAGAGEAGVVP